MKYNIDLEQYAKAAYDKYMNNNGFQDLKDVETFQNLTFQREGGASDIVATSLSLIMRLNSFN
ncbi:hypothetical protein [Streptococcus thermophilus]|uniref:Glucan-binding protein C n=1 Tax=Streptococcus thermophilus TaxID=1308 RepID=A0A7L8WNJ0_STRTR|nr:hypothetical protein [Streptococcus thermophilus]QOH31439.1 hypothetical protein GFB63_09530 [Streptococcus thermophilus]CAD0141711.1 Glucan-binding protein C [Streptococcus thermophilus]CAD0145415.1 Glucan-binding protein C [Streptococcus thermophilus]CAD0152467.1 Glucan-binding protein C [Streptococcus thermophilus]